MKPRERRGAPKHRDKHALRKLVEAGELLDPEISQRELGRVSFSDGIGLTIVEVRIGSDQDPEEVPEQIHGRSVYIMDISVRKGTAVMVRQDGKFMGVLHGKET